MAAMSDCVNFHSQLSSLMEAFSSAAVAEICRLVDDGYAVLRLEVSQSQKENEALKNKLKTMEMLISQGYLEGTEANRDNLVNNHSSEVGVCDALLEERDRVSRTGGRAPGKPLDFSLWRDGESSSMNGEDTPVQNLVWRDTCEDVVERRSLFIKEEKDEEEVREKGDQATGLNSRRERVVELPVNCGNRTPIIGTEELTELHRTRHSIWEVSGLEAVFKAEPEKESVNHRPQRTGSEHRAERLNILGSERSVCQRPSQQRTFFSQGDGAGGADGPTCSNAAETTDSEDMSVQSVLQPSKEEGSGSSLSSLGSPEWKPEVVIIKEEAELRLWEKETVSGALHVQPRHYLDGRMRKEVHLEHFNMCPPKAQTVASKPTAKDSSESSPFDSFSASNSDKTQSKVGSRDKRFFCTFCGKGFSCPKKVEIHQRVHTGEKPFSCTQCRKRFAQSGNLKRHQRVHTGEKPFSCTQCEKRFSHLHQLKMHQRVHTGERPYSCTQCGKRFSERSYLRIHQQKNHIAVYNLN